MFNDIVSNSSVPSGFGRDSKLTQTMRQLAKRRNDMTSTSDVAATFKESDRDRKFSTEDRVVG